MNLELLLCRPSYTTTSSPRQFLSSHHGTATSQTNFLSLIPNTPKVERKREFIFPKTCETKIYHSKPDSVRLQHQQKRARVQDAYNSLSDFNDKRQILSALKHLHSADERIQLIDKVLERKEEMQIATLRLKAKKLEPIFNVIRRKLKDKQRVQSPNSPKSKKDTVIIHNPIIIPEENPKTVEEQAEQEREQAIIQKLQSKFTASVAFSWLTRGNDKVNPIELDSPSTQKRHGRRNTTLQQQSRRGKGDLKQMISKKVSENSDEMIRLGKLKLHESAIKPYNAQEILNNAKSKVDSGLTKNEKPERSLKRKQTLAFVTVERNENEILDAEYQSHQNQIQIKRKLL